MSRENEEIPASAITVCTSCLNVYAATCPNCGHINGSLAITEAAIDYMQGLDNSGFADEFGGIDFLKDNLVKAITEYQS